MVRCQAAELASVFDPLQTLASDEYGEQGEHDRCDGLPDRSSVRLTSLLSDDVSCASHMSSPERHQDDQDGN